jgi:photosystem II stability/assembly factor-like uncharacterized protein
MNSVIRLWCEWDVGQESVVFATEDAARSWAKEALVSAGIDDPIDELEDEALISYSTMEVVA